MVSPLLIVSLVLGMHATVEASTFKREDKRPFTVNRIANPSYAGRNGPKDLLKTYRKYGMPVPEHLTRRLKTERTVFTPKRRASHKHHRRMHAAGSSTIIDVSGSSFGSPAVSHGVNYAANHGSRNQSGSVAADPLMQDVTYLSPVKIGGQTLHMILDTGSSDLWVYGSSLPAQVQKNHRIYNTAASPTWSELQGARFGVMYGDNSAATGHVGTDVVDIGGAIVEKQAIEVADAVSYQFTRPPYNDGVLGLGFSTANMVHPQQQKTFFENVADSLKEPVFTANLKHGTTGSYTFGFIDNRQYRGDLHWTPINKSRGWWQFSSGSATAIADTGTSLILTDPSFAQNYYKQVKDAGYDTSEGGYVFPCNATLPTLWLPMEDGVTIGLPGGWINYTPVSEGSPTCFGSMQPSTSEDGLGVYGDILFKALFFVFDIGNQRIGFAPHADL